MSVKDSRCFDIHGVGHEAPNRDLLSLVQRRLHNVDLQHKVDSVFPISFAAFVLAFVVALMVVPLAKRIASQASIVDRPDTNRKLHGRVVPLSGGIAIGISLPMVLIAAWLFSDAVAESITNNWIPLIGILLAGTILLGVGLADDLWGVGGRRKLLGQALSVAVFLASFFLQNILYETAQENVLWKLHPNRHRLWTIVHLAAWFNQCRQSDRWS